MLLPRLIKTNLMQRLTTARRGMSADAAVWINKDTRVICQGFTGKQVGSV